MLKLPANLNQPFDNFLLEKKFSDKERFFYKKWLRFYWDFCHKYYHDAFHTDSLPLFLQELHEKRQTEQRRNQAKQAVSLFYEMQNVSKQPIPRNKGVSNQSPQSVNRKKANSSHGTLLNSKIPVAQDPVQHPPSHQFSSNPITGNHRPEQPGTSWVFVFDRLVSEIKIRHYSPKTLKAYRGWVRQFQTFTKSKDYRQLSQQDVVDFLSFLAVEKKVSAASQNQAFNALLFLFKQVLKREFGEIKGVARAKRKSYIPVVLSREEIDLIFDHLDDPVGLVAKLLYGCGLRLFECLNLRVQDFNFDAGILTVHDGKGLFRVGLLSIIRDSIRNRRSINPSVARSLGIVEFHQNIGTASYILLPFLDGFQFIRRQSPVDSAIHSILQKQILIAGDFRSVVKQQIPTAALLKVFKDTEDVFGF